MPLSLVLRVREAAGATLNRLGSAPLFASIQAGTAQVESYAGLLESLAIVRNPLEQAASFAKDGPLAAAWSKSLRALPLLEADLAATDGSRGDLDPALRRPALLRAHATASRLRHRTVQAPSSLLGCLVALEGPWLHQPLAPLIAQYGRSARYVASRQRDLPARLETAFASLQDSAQAEAVAAAAETIEDLTRVVEALDPLPPVRPRGSAADLNPYAGTHAVPDDLREVAAALRAGERSWRDWPYYLARYGARGQRYTFSDSAWIASLAREVQADVDRQINWLATLLAARGMPRLLLEEHLFILQDELSRAIPGRTGEFARLGQAGEMLRANRQKHMDDAVMRRLAEAFERRIGPGGSEYLPRAGMLLAAAVADERGGHKRAVPSLTDWLADPSRFPPEWIAAVQTTLDEARA